MESPPAENSAVLRAPRGNSRTVVSSTLPASTRETVSRIRPVESVAATAGIDADVYRTEWIPAEETKGLTTLAVDVGRDRNRS